MKIHLSLLAIPFARVVCNALTVPAHREAPFGFFTNDEGRNCTYVEPEDPSWGWTCDNGLQSPRDLGLSDLHPRDPIAEASLTVAKATAGQTGVLILLSALSVLGLYGILKPVTSGGGKTSTCFSNLAGTYTTKTKGGNPAYVYYCLSKTIGPGGGCGLYLNQHEEQVGIARSHDYWAAHDDKVGCIQYKTSGAGMVIKVKTAAYSANKQVENPTLESAYN